MGEYWVRPITKKKIVSCFEVKPITLRNSTVRTILDTIDDDLLKGNTSVYMILEKNHFNFLNLYTRTVVPYHEYVYLSVIDKAIERNIDDKFINYSEIDEVCDEPFSNTLEWYRNNMIIYNPVHNNNLYQYFSNMYSYYERVLKMNPVSRNIVFRTIHLGNKWFADWLGKHGDPHVLNSILQNLIKINYPHIKKHVFYFIYFNRRKKSLFQRCPFFRSSSVSKLIDELENTDLDINEKYKKKIKDILLKNRIAMI